jgi:hypothetical protein
MRWVAVVVLVASLVTGAASGAARGAAASNGGDAGELEFVHEGLTRGR